MRGQNPRDTYIADRQFEDGMKCVATRLGKLFLEQIARYNKKEIDFDQFLANMAHIERKHGINAEHTD